MKRDLINEIAEIKSRSEFNSRHDFSNRLQEIENAFNESNFLKDGLSKELLKYIPISTIACFEAFFRSVYKELIDHGKPYSENAIKFNQSKNVKFDFDIINAIQTKVVTIGDFISHILPCNNLDDINLNLSVLLNDDFLKTIKQFNKESIFEEFNETTKHFTENYAQIIVDVKRNFELRHIFCHEFATNVIVDKDEILRCFTSAKIFLNHINHFIWNLIYPNAPETQSGMNTEIIETFEKSELELEELILEIKEISKNNELLELNFDLFDECIIQWKKYREIKSELEAFYVIGGSMHPTIYFASMLQTTKEKIESLTNEYDFWFKKNASR